MRYANLIWAIAQWGTRYRFAAKLRESESWLSRSLSSRVAFTDEERRRIAQTLGYPAEWLFQEPTPPRGFPTLQDS